LELTVCEDKGDVPFVQRRFNPVKGQPQVTVKDEKNLLATWSMHHSLESGRDL
jgi:hypothetical protein